ncbi:hypothetical protein BJ875DRAFT_40619 [Amylocarpus encephaloides]|uniref:PLD phosphodiesterase domain-containing protein n=1 Tax=Amylocarpus encephaloides TaxID=45428 RepID=A0A9P7YSY0_9HELO|nr:hypothetical protein BJ875DRAFT_40619 [Amylocarpus encephaloides]
MVSEKVYQLCRTSESVSAVLARDPTIAPSDAWKALFAQHDKECAGASVTKAHHDAATPEDLKRAYNCGKWGPKEPSELFLRLYHDALCTIDKSVSGCMVSPSLMGSCGTVPLTVISVVPDIMRHMSNLIVRAEKEVVLATNYWQNSIASKYITNAMKELSNRASARGERIVFKLEYDRGSAKQVLDNHMEVTEEEYLGKAISLPTKNEIPNLDLQVINYHRPLVGTFHSKYMVVDRKYAVLQSNNIQDNDNMEMMIHLEGPIVDSLYDMALISWSKKLEPPLPSHNSPAVHGDLSSFGGTKEYDPTSVRDGVIKESSDARHSSKIQDQQFDKHGSDTIDPASRTKLNGIINSGLPNILTGPSTSDSVTRPANGERKMGESRDKTNRLPNEQNLHFGFEKDGLRKTELLRENARAAITTGDVEHIVHQETRDGTSNKTFNSIDKTNSSNSNGSADPNRGGSKGPDIQSRRYFGSGEQIIPQFQIEHPSSGENPLPEHTTEDPHYDKDIAGEISRVQTAVSPNPTETRVQSVTRHLNHTKNVGFTGNASECEPHHEMAPYIPHPVQEHFPIAMVCREPYGTPNHQSVYNPQNEVWLSALRNAKNNVFIQSPTLNAEPLVPAIIEACERGIDVYCYICLGYNDTVSLIVSS